MFDTVSGEAGVSAFGGWEVGASGTARCGTH
jgi:hypothetical protein